MAAMSVALVAAVGIISALCLGLATPAGVAAAALADILACAAVALAVASYITSYPACPRLTANSPRPDRWPGPGRHSARSWEQDTLNEADWQRWEREVFGGPAQPPGRRPPPPGSDLG
jgi:hypothetical protein